VHLDGPLAGFPGFLSVFRRFDPVVDGVADQVDQRIADPIEDTPVEFDVLAGHLEFDRLVLIAGDVAGRPAVSGSSPSRGGHQTDVHHCLLQIGRQVRQRVEFRLECVVAVVVGLGRVPESDATRHQSLDGEQRVDLFDIDPDRLDFVSFGVGVGPIARLEDVDLRTLEFGFVDDPDGRFIVRVGVRIGRIVAE